MSRPDFLERWSYTPAYIHNVRAAAGESTSGFGIDGGRCLTSGVDHILVEATRRVGDCTEQQLSAGLPLLPHLRHASDLSVAGGNRAAQNLLSRAHMPSAIFALGTTIAVGVLQAAQERSLGVPRDLSLITFDDTGTTSITSPPLTAVRQPLQGEGRVGVDMLYRLIEGQKLDAQRIELSTELIIRGSTAPPHGASFLT